MRNARLDRIALVLIWLVGFAAVPVAEAQEYTETRLSSVVHVNGPSILAGSPLLQEPATDPDPILLTGRSGLSACHGATYTGIVAASCSYLDQPTPRTPSAARVRLDSNMMLRQGIAGAAGGLGGALLLVLPAAIAERGGQDVSGDVTAVLATIGYMGGSVLGVQYYSRRQGLTGSWWGTLGGAVLGGLGGSLFVLTVPTGAVLGFTLVSEDWLP